MVEKNDFIGYEYREVHTKRGLISVYVDGYENFGWSLEDTESPIGKIDTAVLKFKRNRKLCNKAELTRLQRQFDAILNEIITMEESKQSKAAIVACIVGIIGTAFMAGSVFAITSNMIALCIILAIPAFVGWLAPYFIYKVLLQKRTEHMNPLIDGKYDELYEVCEKGHNLL